ncbi:hypothetical protein GW17_00053366 [Ensete ventricosum]|nr:hypothetical protein GW17_00053366 [Ensete ventricosum]
MLVPVPTEAATKKYQFDVSSASASTTLQIIHLCPMSMVSATSGRREQREQALPFEAGRHRQRAVPRTYHLRSGRRSADR